MAGIRVARTIFYQIGNAIGRRAFEYSREEVAPDTLENVIDGVLSLRGWGRVASFKRTESSSGVDFECSFRDCIICHQRTAREPVCDVMRGLFAGWLESFLGKKARSSVESQCRAMGKSACVFEIVFTKRD